MKKFGFYKFKWFALVKWMNNFCKPMKSVDLFWPCFGRVEMVCFSRCLLPAVTLGSSSCLSSVSGMTSKEKASPLLSTAVLFGFVAGSPTTDGLWEKLSNNWTLCDHESFEELWHLNVFSAIFMQITFYFSIYTEIDFDHVHLWLWKNYWYCLPSLCDLKSKHKLWKCQCFCCFKHVNLSKFVFIHSDHVCL